MNPGLARGALAVLLLLGLACSRPDPRLHAGYARVPVPWRVGAKPGQVGTNALPERDQLFAQAVDELLPVLMPETLEPEPYLQAVTDWVLDQLRFRTEDVVPGKYHQLFEASDGVELVPDVKAIVLARGKTKLAIVRADLYVMHEQLHRRVAELVAPATGIDGDHLLLVATHNHSTPHAVSPAPGVWTLADAFDPRHFVYLAHRIADAVREADARRVPVELRVSGVTLDTVQMNVIGPGTAEMAPPGGGAAVPVPVGYPRDHFDSDLTMLRFDRAEGGGPLAALFVLGIHAEAMASGHGMISGDWPARAEEFFAERAGTDVVWLPGPLGDVEPDGAEVSPDHPYFRGGFETRDAMASLVADAAERAFEAAGTRPGEAEPRLEVLFRRVPGPPGRPIPDSSYLGGFRMPMTRLIQDGTRFPLQVVRLGEVLLLATPAEPTTDLAWNIESRVDAVEGNLYQGYLWPGAPDWVHARVEQNFEPGEIEAGRGALRPVVVSHANGYMGYIVSRWEYENRQHYRESLTAYGPGTADHVARALLAMVDELEGGPEYWPALPPWQDVDDAGFDAIAGLLRGLDDPVRAMARALPPSNPARVGGVEVDLPPEVPMGVPVELTWIGGTNDLPPPTVHVEARDGGAWLTRGSGPSAEVWVLFEAPDRWTARWSPGVEVAGAEVRLRVVGAYRGTDSGAGEGDPLWDPEGRDVRYEVVSGSARVLR